jgi:hypothetical protein
MCLAIICVQDLISSVYDLQFISLKLPSHVNSLNI